MSLFSYCDFFQSDDYEYGFGRFICGQDVKKPTIDKNFNIVWPKGYTANDALEWRRSKGMSSIIQLATKAFEKRERVKVLAALNLPADYEDRKRAFIELETARYEAIQAESALRSAQSETMG